MFVGFYCFGMLQQNQTFPHCVALFFFFLFLLFPIILHNSLVSCTESNGVGHDEQTLVILKPDAVQRGLVGKLISRFENRGFELVRLELVQASEGLLREHYASLASKPFFEDLLKYMQLGPSVAMVWQGTEVVRLVRGMMGDTDPAMALPGTIRADFAHHISRNLIHGSDSVEAAQREIALWFGSPNNLNHHNNNNKNKHCERNKKNTNGGFEEMLSCQATQHWTG